MTGSGLPRGIVHLLETPFLDSGEFDCESLAALVEGTVAAGVHGLTAPLVASEVHALTTAERETVVKRIAEVNAGRVPFIVGASSEDPEISRHFARVAEQVGAAAYLVAVPNPLYGHPDELVAFLKSIVTVSRAPLVLQDLQWNGPGLELETMRRLRDEIPTLAGFKIETVPAGKKYTAVREAFGPDVYISGGWAVPQLIEALDRGVDGMIPESAMAPVYCAIYNAYSGGDRPAAVKLFRELVPVLVFSNQEIFHSIAFFKRMLVRKGLLRSEFVRAPGYIWDRYSLRVADELIEYYLALEARVRGGGYGASARV